MELREFAEQVLFATTLDEKLRGPGTITDERPGPAFATPAMPGRPSGLNFQAAASGASDFPGLHRLESAHERGRLLHFFANHELLATELMALVLLRFPDAPAGFRQGVFQTLRDEQIHTRLYLERIKACGLQFGDLPVNGYFWRTVSPMQNPMDYVAALSLTFEQANLDYCRQYSQALATVGDDASARVLDRIYRDEIAHVAHGLKWFRRWKAGSESDWEAFCRQLKFPLSPQRAKGITFNVAGRRAAGLDPEFIDELNVFAQSKGRTPGVFLFNPFTEEVIAHGRDFTPGKRAATLARDLANLPQFLGRTDDLVLLPKRPSVQFLSTLKQAGFPLPEFVELNDQVANSAGILRGRKLGRLRPWAWGPDSVALLAPLFSQVTGEVRGADQCFNDGIARLYSKAWSAAILRTVLSRFAKECWLCPAEDIGVVVDKLDDALAAISAIRRRGHHRVVVKESFGCAGRNMIRLWESTLLPAQRRWLEQGARKGQLVVEPWLERAVDFSVQLEMGAAGLKLCGYTGLINDRKGQFRANWAEAKHHRKPPESAIRCWPDSGTAAQKLPKLYVDLISYLEAELRQLNYLGPVGIDAFVYRTASGDFRLKPIVEINPRYTMGRLTLELMKHVHPGSCGVFRLLNEASIRSAGFSCFNSYAQAQSERFPVRLAGEPNPKIREGLLCLNDPAEVKACLATFQVGRTLDALLTHDSVPNEHAVRPGSSD